MLEQFVASGVVVKDEIIDIDSDYYSHVVRCLRSFEYSQSLSLSQPTRIIYSVVVVFI
jgi:hypothetical protein